MPSAFLENQVNSWFFFSFLKKVLTVFNFYDKLRLLADAKDNYMLYKIYDISLVDSIAVLEGDSNNSKYVTISFLTTKEFNEGYIELPQIKEMSENMESIYSKMGIVSKLLDKCIQEYPEALIKNTFIEEINIDWLE